MLPRMAATCAIAVSGALVALTATPAAAVRGADWTPSSWTGVTSGAPVPDVSLTGPQPAPLTPAPYLPITYEGQSGCDPTPKPGAIAMADVIRATYGAQQVIGIPRGCEVGGRSEHKEGRAVDWMIDVRKPAERALAEAYLNWLLGPDQAGRQHGHAYQLGVMYIGWHDRMWRAYRPEVGWTELKGCFSKPDSRYDNTCHRNHIHISLTWAGASGNTAPGIPVVPAETPAPPPRPPAPAQPGEDADDFMSIGSEVGFASGPDLPLSPGEIRTVNLASVPLNATSALVHVTTRQASSKGRLRIGMVAESAAVSVKVPKRRIRTSVIQVPVANGAVQIAAPRSGPVDVRVDVLGYTTDGGDHPAVGGAPAELFRGLVAPDAPQRLDVAGVGPVPKRLGKSTAVILKVQAKGRGTDGRVSAYPSTGVDLGTTSAPVSARGARTSLLAADVGSDGAITLSASVPTRAVVEIVGFVRR